MEYQNYVIYLFVCLALSFAVGLERQYRRRFIGLRTTILVALGSYLYVSTSFLITNGEVDMTRIAAQVVSGMGFLGAGVIIKDGVKVRGLTTAATLWCDAAIGVLCAGGFIKEAVAGTFAILFANVILRYINSIVNKQAENHHISEKYNIQITGPKDQIREIKTYMEQFYTKENITVLKMNETNDKQTELIYEINIIKNKSKKLEKQISSINTNYKIENISLSKQTEEENEDDEEL